MEDSGMSKGEALASLQVQVSLGRQLLGRTATTEADLATLTHARVEWNLANKKLLHHLFGDAAGQVRLAHTLHDDERSLRPNLEERVREFQELVIAGLADLERLLQALKRMP